MQFRDLKTQYKTLKKDIDAEIDRVTGACNFINGEQVGELENALAEYVGVKHCITCANGTDALSLAMFAWGIGEGDAVFVPDFTFFSSGEIVAHAGATPIFVDVDKKTFNIDTIALEKAIVRVKQHDKLKAKAVVAVDLFGLPADMDAIKKTASKHNLWVLEDGAQGFGGSIREQKACCFGDISTTSFFPAKPLGCYGDGGAIFTNDDKMAALIASIKVHGKGNNKYDNVRIGLNSRLDTIQAAILKVKLKAFVDYELENVNEVATKYTEKLADIVEIPVVPDGFISSWAQYTVKLGDAIMRNKVQSSLKVKNIPSMIYYPKPMHSQEAFEKWKVTDYMDNYNDSNFVNTRELCDTVLSLPMHPYMTNRDIDTVVREIWRVIK